MAAPKTMPMGKNKKLNTFEKKARWSETKAPKIAPRIRAFKGAVSDWISFNSPENPIKIPNITLFQKAIIKNPSFPVHEDIRRRFPKTHSIPEAAPKIIPKIILLVFMIVKFMELLKEFPM
ncbi:MAG: hypothetical protein ACFFCZ_30145 [Promethearchaeota archaeon]